MTRVKICCIASIEEALLAVRYGASAVGLVSAMPSGPGVIPEELIAEIAAVIPPGVSSFLLTSLQSAEKIIEQQKRCGTNTIQICDRVTSGTHAEIKRALPGIKIVQVIHVTGEESVGEARTVSKDVDAILLDSGNQSLPVKELGGKPEITRFKGLGEISPKEFAQFIGKQMRLSKIEYAPRAGQALPIWSAPSWSLAAA